MPKATRRQPSFPPPRVDRIAGLIEAARDLPDSPGRRLLLALAGRPTVYSEDVEARRREAAGRRRGP